ncbi:MAG: energy transducer TonB [Pyrinomonadaceae bacterium]
MRKALTRLTLAALAAALCVTAAAAQTTLEWIVLSPPGEKFTARMPKRPAPAGQSARAGGLSAVGRRYAAAADARTTFTVWSLKETTGAWRLLSTTDNSAEGVGPESLYLDGVAGLAWELLGEPEFERLRREPAGLERAAELELGMSYVRDFELNGRPAREYLLKLEKARGPVYVTAVGAHVYVLAGLGEDADDPRLRKFADSFVVVGGRAPAREPESPSLPPPSEVKIDAAPILPPAPAPANPSLPVPATIEADPLLLKPDPNPSNAPGNTGRGDAPAASDRPFRHTEVTRKAMIIFKPEPGFTEEARRFNVTGVVRLRGILGSDGRVKALSVVKPLPHGLTRKALVAARSLRFQPAQKDGRPVSQYVVLEYNFNIY